MFYNNNSWYGYEPITENQANSEFLGMEKKYKIRYRDEYVGSSWLSPNGVAAPDNVTVVVGGINYVVMSFDGASSEERISNQFEMAHDVSYEYLNKGDVKLEVHVHFMPSTNAAGKIKWFFDYTYIPTFSDALPQSSIELNYNIVANSQYEHILIGAEIPKPSVGFNLGDLIMFTIRRNPVNVDDTYPDDAYLLKSALHVPTDDRGSTGRYEK